MITINIIKSGFVRAAIFSACILTLAGCGAASSVSSPDLTFTQNDRGATPKYEMTGPEGSFARYSRVTNTIQLRLAPNLGHQRPDIEYARLSLPDLFDQPGAFAVAWTLTPEKDLFAHPKTPTELATLAAGNRKIFHIRALNGKIWASLFDETGEERFYEIDPRLTISNAPLAQKLKFGAVIRGQRTYQLFVNQQKIADGAINAASPAPILRFGLQRHDLQRFIGQVIPAQSAEITGISVESF